MKHVVLVSDRDAGGAAVACRRLFVALRGMLGADALWVAGSADCGSGAVSARDWPGLFDLALVHIVSALRCSESVLRRLQERLGNRSVLAVVNRERPRVVHAHGLHEGVSFELVKALAARHPVLWTLHDMAPLTGYCYYSHACEKYLTGCVGDCPQMGRCGVPVRSPAIEWRRRQAFYEASPSRVVHIAPSRWMAACARRRFRGRVRVEHLANGVDLRVFRPLPERRAIRSLLGLPLDRPLVLSGAASLGEDRKGVWGLADVIARLTSHPGGRPGLVVLGEQDSASSQSADVIAAGYVHDEALLNLYYNAVDAFVLPTRADNLPNMLVEAIAAGCPCVATRVGGCEDAVHDAETGLLAAPDAPESLVTAVDQLLKSVAGDRNSWSERCRLLAEREFDIERQAMRHMTLYNEVLESSG